MTEEIRIDDLGVAPGVLETIVSLAAQSVPGVACLGGAGLAGLVGKAKGGAVDVTQDDGSLKAVVHLQVRYGEPLHAVAADVQRAVAEALLSQVGKPVSAVDVFVDGVVFEE
ncbi:MAG: Asp23/Gls24 family envelope stress response protein [Coriobacteriia bacterium]|nr:Asp23/Gls24 family envelope stress response protein [Coriobacteriia bacterium]